MNLLSQSKINIFICILILIETLFFLFVFKETNVLKNFPSYSEKENEKNVTFFSSFRQDIFFRTEKILPKNEAVLLEGMLFGRRNVLPRDLENAIRRLGLSHILVVSGYNISLMIQALFWFFIFIGFWRRQVFWISIFSIFFLVGFIGFEPSVIRAAIMAMIVLFVRESGRCVRPMLLLVYTATIMVILDPWIIFMISFQLSFAATAGLLFLGAPLQKFFSAWKVLPSWLVSSLASTLSAFIFTEPIIFYHFRMLSVLGIIANILVIPTVPFIMLSGFLSLILTYIWFPLGKFFAFFPWVLLQYFQWIIRLFTF